MLETKPLVYKYSKYCKIIRVKIQRNKLHKKIVGKTSIDQTNPSISSSFCCLYHKTMLCINHDSHSSKWLMATNLITLKVYSVEI